MLLGMEEVDDLDGLGEVFGGGVPDPGSTVSQDDLDRGGIEAGSLALREYQSGKVGGSGIGIPGSGPEDPSGVAD